ncbi:MAG: hypothetical protein JWM85_2169 [Acidimicrobiaceae bacterium]|nr:hypothetical protein [Acidimicrobiaceae bacterium]
MVKTVQERRRTVTGRRTVGVAWTPVMALVGFAVVAAACASGPSAGVASLGSTSTTIAAIGSAATSGMLPGPQKASSDQLAYAECMRLHGLTNFPDPILTSHGGSPPNPYDRSSPRYKAADDACKHLLPFGGGSPSPAQVAAITAQLLRYAQCMRSHGVPSFPDPTVNSHEIGFSITGSPRSPAFQRAEKACRALGPRGG